MTPLGVQVVRQRVVHRVDVIAGQHLGVRPEVVAPPARRVDDTVTELIEHRPQRALVDATRAAEHSPAHHPPSTTMRISVISFTEYAGPSRVLPLSLTPPYGCWSARHVGPSLTTPPP